MDWFAMDPLLMRYLGQTAPWANFDQAAASRTALIFRPVQAEDADLIVAMHQRLSEETVFRRYHSPRVPTRREIDQICQLSGENGRTLAATVSGKNTAVVGLAYYVVSAANTAEMALLVEDRYQGQGIGKRLLQQLVALAVAQGICYFDAFVLPTNKAMLHLLEQTGPMVYNRLGYGARELRIQLTAVPTFNLVWEPQKPAVEEAVYLAA
ncbi:MAG: GNAT family N-acetyltransferase [Anaerolineaceae bacterium]|nr:GNAT family N-acetyltransferase [Anaerolineaceae bacterium]